MKVATVVYCLREGEILLGMKKVRFGAGKWNGFGGRVEVNESVTAAAVRELREECGLETQEASLEKVGEFEFYFKDMPQFQCHIFFVREWSGEPQESDEMAPKWFPLNALPLKDMWSSDLFWLPAVLAGNILKGECHFDAEGKVVETFEIERVLF